MKAEQAPHSNGESSRASRKRKTTSMQTQKSVFALLTHQLEADCLTISLEDSQDTPNTRHYFTCQEP